MSPSPTTGPVYAKSARPVDVAAAFEEHRRTTPRGLVRPIIVPATASTTVAQKREACARADAARPRRLGGGMDLQDIRQSRYAVGGVAHAFGVVGHGHPIRLERGAFAEAIACRGLSLFLNHPDAGEEASLASMTDGSLHVEEDWRGCWFEAAFRDDPPGREAFRLVWHGEVTGVSFGWRGGAVHHEHGTAVFSHVNAWELSLLTAPSRPRFQLTWVRPSAEALRRRQAFL